jgi:hypothetical protein
MWKQCEPFYQHNLCKKNTNPYTTKFEMHAYTSQTWQIIRMSFLHIIYAMMHFSNT